MRITLDATLPEGWWVCGLRELRTPQVYVGDVHNPMGLWVVELQHVWGGLLTTADGATPQAALDAAIARIQALPERITAKSQIRTGWHTDIRGVKVLVIVVQPPTEETDGRLRLAQASATETLDMSFEDFLIRHYTRDPE